VRGDDFCKEHLPKAIRPGSEGQRRIDLSAKTSRSSLHWSAQGSASRRSESGRKPLPARGTRSSGSGAHGGAEFVEKDERGGTERRWGDPQASRSPVCSMRFTVSAASLAAEVGIVPAIRLGTERVELALGVSRERAAESARRKHRTRCALIQLLRCSADSRGLDNVGLSSSGCLHGPERKGSLDD
jgi:hypothetical protein